MLVTNDREFIQRSRKAIVDFCSESPELTEVIGGFVLKELRGYRKFREFAPESFKMNDAQFCQAFGGYTT